MSVVFRRRTSRPSLGALRCRTTLGHSPPSDSAPRGSPLAPRVLPVRHARYFSRYSARPCGSELEKSGRASSETLGPAARGGMGRASDWASVKIVGGSIAGGSIAAAHSGAGNVPGLIHSLALALVREGWGSSLAGFGA